MMRRTSMSLALLVASVLLSSMAIPVSASKHGSSRRLLDAGAYEVLWFNAETAAGEIHSFYWMAEDVGVTIWVVAQSQYNLTAGGEPVNYLGKTTGKSGEYVLTGPLPELFYVILSQSSQWISSETWVENQLEQGVRVYVPPIGTLALGTLLIAAIYTVVGRRKKQTVTGDN